EEARVSAADAAEATVEARREADRVRDEAQRALRRARAEADELLLQARRALRQAEEARDRAAKRNLVDEARAALAGAESVRSDAGLAGLDRDLDDAAVAGGVRLRVIHGKGTGALRTAIRAALSSHPLVRAHEPAGPSEGGDGATIVTL